MITSKRFPAIVAVLLCFSLLFCGVAIYAAHAIESNRVLEYENKLFGDELLTIDIQVDKDDWEDAMSNAQSKEWVSGDLIINGEQFSGVGIRTKGNSSLSMGRMGNSETGQQRYSLSFKANKYVKGQTFYGLDSFCINNMMGDATYMKDYMAYEIMDYIGVEAPLRNYASVTVNGEDYGFFITLERYDEAYLERTTGSTAGQLYSAKISMGMRGDFEGDFDAQAGFRQPNRGNQAVSDAEGFVSPEGLSPPEGGPGEMPDGLVPQTQTEQQEKTTAADNTDNTDNAANAQPGGRGGMMGGFGGRGGGGSLIYTDDNFSSYSSILENSVFNKTSDREKQRIVTAIKNLNEGTDLEKYWDVDGILRYFAAHTFVVNHDSYTSNMQQNYYLYEKDGKISVLPWDYGLAFGGMSFGGGGTLGASGVVNFPIDTPVSGVSMEDRPLLNKLLEVEEYRERYHEYVHDISENYIQGGSWEKTITELNEKIGKYVKNDGTALFTYEQYEASLPVFTELGLLRAESILGQLDGSIPSTTEGQQEDSTALVDSSSINLSALGSMGGGMGGQRGDMEQQAEGQDGRPGGMVGGFGGMPDMGGIDRELMGQAMQILMAAGFEVTDTVKEELLALGLTEEQIETASNMMGGMGGGFPGGGRFAGAENAEGGANAGMPGGNMPGMPQSNPASAQIVPIAVLCVALLLVLGGAITFVAWPRKNKI